VVWQGIRTIANLGQLAAGPQHLDDAAATAADDAEEDGNDNEANEAHTARRHGITCRLLVIPRGIGGR
jgi:hypothetical protein